MLEIKRSTLRKHIANDKHANRNIDTDSEAYTYNKNL